MDNLPANFTCKENVLVLCVVSFFFGLAAGVVALACLLKIGENVVWAVPGLAAAALLVALWSLAFNALRQRQVITVTPENISSRSMAQGKVEIPWHEVEQVSEEDTKGARMRGAMPGFQIILAMYLSLPLFSGTERHSLITVKALDDRTITVRSHMLYPHRLEQLRHALDRYARRASQSIRLLRTNINN